MPIISETYQVDSLQSILREDFKNNKRNWEEITNESEYAEIREGYYWLQNKTISRWNYYKTKTTLKQKQDFILEANVELVEKGDSLGHFGLIWGFDKNREQLNRFTISANGQRALIMHFEKDHKITFHRFHIRKAQKVNMKKSIRMSMIKIGDYFHFFINMRKIYTAHHSIFCNNGPFVGYYVEPGLYVKSNFMEIKKLRTKQLLLKNGLEMFFEQTI